MKILAIYSGKGGVGKTATAVNLSSIIAQSGKRVLLCDMDSQGAASYYFRILPKKKYNSRKLLEGKFDKYIKKTEFANLDLLPAHFSFRNLDLALSRLSEEGRPNALLGVFSHLHVDHVGWNTMLKDGKWVPTFPSARYLMGETEFNHWRAESDGREGQTEVMHDSVLPVFDADLVDLVKTDHTVCPEVSLQSTPGHTPGHVSVKIESEGEHALITGDFLHHPCQFVHPEWSSAPDSDRPQAIATRRSMYASLADQPVLVIGTHFATPTAGYLKKDGDAYRLDT